MSKSAPNLVLPPDVIEAFASAAVTALHELAQIDAVPDETVPASAWSAHPVAAAVQLMRPLAGTMTLLVPGDAASRLARCYLPNDTDLGAEMVDDVVGEFANVIAGQAKTMLKGTPYHFRLSLPVVSRPKSLEELRRIASSPPLATLTWESGTIAIFVDLQPCPGA